MKIKTLALLLSLTSAPLFAAPLQLDVYNPQENAIFPVSSTLVSGPKEAILFDAQFSTKDGEKLVEMIKKSGKSLKAIVITSGDPDFYFGLEPIVKAFPNVKVLATPHVVEHIRATKDAKLQYWGPQMKDGAPAALTIPQATTETQFTIDGKRWNCATRTITPLTSGSRRTAQYLAERESHPVSMSGRRIPSLLSSVRPGVMC
ncbi:Arsenate reductase and related proteins, glutaredoxin family [Citrobacter koseri]|nr:Arsenate reductase and related proteins, glutaredoxin family [Citrobacter koseri]